jgi:hypothetical protein
LARHQRTQPTAAFARRPSLSGWPAGLGGRPCSHAATGGWRVRPIPMCDDTRNDHQLELGTCPMCGRTFPIEGRSIYCGPTCRQRAFRLRRRQVHRSTLPYLTEMLRRERRLTAQTIYECPSGNQRFLGERRCGDCNLMCRRWVSEVNAPSVLRSSRSPTCSVRIWKEVPWPKPPIPAWEANQFPQVFTRPRHDA